jgi:DNA-binding beta-propeller fold protein YncE
MRAHRWILLLALATVGSVTAAAPADAASPPVSQPRVIAHFDLGQGQTPENIVLEPDGRADVTFALAAQVARVSRAGKVRSLAQFPFTAGKSCPVLGPLTHASAFTMGITRDDKGTLFVALCTGSPQLQGIWRLTPTGSRSRIAALPPNGLPNGIALDKRHGLIYVADSLLRTVWRVSVADGVVAAWATGSHLSPNEVNGFIGANGLKVHDGAVWVSNTDRGTLLRIPIRRDGAAGPIETVATGLDGIDDFAFTGRGDDASILAAINGSSVVKLIQPSGNSQTVLTATDGLSNPTSIAVGHDAVYVPSAAYVTQKDPNLLLARLDD